MPSIIKVEDVWKIYNLGEVKVPALQGININIKKGEFVTLLGKSGSGKSTAMNIIGLLDLATKGNVYLEDKNIRSFKEDELALIRGKKIGFIFQSFNLIPSLTALENVMLPMMFQGIEEEDMKKIAKEKLDMVEMSHRLTHRPNSLSGGERQRVAIARSLVNDPELVLADEPTGNLDSKTGRVVMGLLQELNKKHKKTVLVITHDLNLAKYSKRKIYLKDGKVVNKL